MLNFNPFDKYYKEYDGWFDKNKYTYLSELRLLKSLLPKNKIGLEIGIGSGRFAMPLKIKYGIDNAQNMVDFCKQKGIEAYYASAEKPPFKNDFFDFVLLNNTVCFLLDLDIVFKEIFRVLKKDGILIVGFIDKDSFLGDYYSKKVNSKFYKLANFYSSLDILLFLAKNNFFNYKIKQTLFSLPKEIKNIEKIKDFYGEGGFVAIKSEKKIC